MTPLRGVGDYARYALITGGGLGLAPVAPGTFGTVAAVPIAVAVHAWCEPGAAIVVIWALALALLAFGCAQTTFTARAFGAKDPGAFVLDEVVGYLVAVGLSWCVLGPFAWFDFAIVFALFRVFDIAKLPPARRLEALPGAPGIMLDDVAAGFQAGVVAIGLRWVGLS